MELSFAASPTGARKQSWMSHGDKARFQILVCDGPSCAGCPGMDELRAELAQRIDASEDLKQRVGVVDFTCFGRCGEGPNLLVRPLEPKESLTEEPRFDRLDGIEGFYCEVGPSQLARVLDEHCGQGKPVKDLVESY